MAATVKVVGCLSVVIFLFSLALSSPVPVLIWSKQSLPSLGSPSLAGHSLPFTEFKSQVIDKLLSAGPQTVVLFVYDKLSVDDFTIFGGSQDDSAFFHLHNDLDASTSSFIFPSVNMVYSSLLSEIKTKINGNVMEIQSKDVSSLSLDQLKSGAMNILICHMESLKDASKDHVKNIFSRNDKLIAHLTDKVSKVTPDFTFLLTAKEPSQVVNERQREAIVADHHIRTGRHLLETVSYDNKTLNPNGTLFVGSNCIFVYTEGMMFNFMNRTYDLMNSSYGIKFKSEARCGNDSSSLTVKMTSSYEMFKSMDLVFNFNKSSAAKSWYCAHIALTVTSGSETTQSDYDCSGIGAAQPYSYHCSLPLEMKVLQKNDTSSLIFKEIQVQAFGLKNSRFSKAEDCVGFFTIPIWMGIFSVSIILTILLGGICAMMSIQTMDRFDDPKGPAVNMASDK